MCQKFIFLMQNKFWRYFNLADYSLQHMKLCSFMILAVFKFGVMDPNHQIKVIARISAYTVCSNLNATRLYFFYFEIGMGKRFWWIILIDTGILNVGCNCSLWFATTRPKINCNAVSTILTAYILGLSCSMLYIYYHIFKPVCSANSHVAHLYTCIIWLHLTTCNLFHK